MKEKAAKSIKALFGSSEYLRGLEISTIFGARIGRGGKLPKR